MKTLANLLTFTLALFTMFSCNANDKKNPDPVAIASIEHHEPEKQYIKVALLLDTSNSMDGLIDQAKAQLWEIVNELSYAKCDDKRPDLQIALYEYGNDNLNSMEGYIRQVIAFSDDLDDISKHLFSLTTNGGNEYCGQVIHTALNQLNWGTNEKDLKLIFIAGNEPFTQGKINYKEATSLALDNDVTVNTIFCGDYNQGIATYWKDGADIAHGDYMAINHNQATTYVATPYDDKILKLNTQLNGTYVAYGYLGESKKVMQSNQDTNAMGNSSQNAVSRTVSKSSHLYKNGKWDLVDAAEDAEFEVEDLKEKDLPAELKGKSTAEIKTYIDKKRVERKKIQKQIQQLNIERMNYIKTQNSKNENGLENAMIKAIKAQAKSKNYKW